MSNFIVTVEHDLEKAWGFIKGVVDEAAMVVWADFKPVLSAIEPVLYDDLKSFVVQALNAVGHGGDLATIEAALLNDLEATSGALFGQAKGLGSTLLQIIIGVVKAGIPAPVVQPAQPQPGA